MTHEHQPEHPLHGAGTPSGLSRTAELPSILTTPEEAAAALGVTDSHLDELLVAGKLTLITICGKRRCLRREIQGLAVEERAA